VEVIDPRTVSPLDEELICNSVTKTQRLMVADPGWKSVGIASEIITMVCEKLGSTLKTNPIRFSFPDSHTPMSAALEEEYYPDDLKMAQAVRVMQ
jgi:pyruvate dehydrogenase E1 component beta subunit